jgi:phage terminase small subunit
MAKGDVLQFKQKRFCREYVKNGGNGTQAYKDAGYVVANDTVASVEATKLLANPKVKEELATLMAPQDEEDIMSIKERRQKLTEIATSADSASSDVMKAIDLLNKMDSLYLQRQEVTGAVPVTIIEDVPETD